MFRKVLQSVLKSGRKILDDKVRISKGHVFKNGKGYKGEQNVSSITFNGAVRFQSGPNISGWFGQFCKDGLSSKAIAFAKAQRANLLRRYYPLTRRLGVSSSLFAFVAFNINLVDDGSQGSTDYHFEHICETIKERVISKEEQQDSAVDIQLNVRNLDFGEMIAKGSDAAVHKAKKVDSEENRFEEGTDDQTSLCLMETDNRFDLAVKVMYNFDLESNSDAIVRGMRKELLPLQYNEYEVENSLWEKFLRNSPPKTDTRRRLQPHPNIIKIEEVLVDDMQELAGCHDEYSASLPQSVNPHGFGRNKTLYIVMKRFPLTLDEYLLQQKEDNLRVSVLLWLQLLEGVLHLQQSDVAHRDIKSNNILVDMKDSLPQLVITDFGCSFDGHGNLLARYEEDIVDKGGNAALMAPEIACARPAPGRYLDFSKSDLWAAGTLAYEIFGMENPFYAWFLRKDGVGLRNDSYRENELPDLPDYVPSYLNKLVKSVLMRNPAKRPDTLLLSNALHVLLWAPGEWLTCLNEGEMRPGRVEVMRWLLLLTADYTLDRSQSVEHTLKGLFLARLDLSQVIQAIDLLWSNN